MTAERFVTSFVGRLRARTVELSRYGAQEAATACEAVADELERDFEAWWASELTVSQAAGESGYSVERLRELVCEGTIAGRRVGASGEVRIPRSALPRRPQRRKPVVEELADQIVAGRHGRSKT